MKSTEFKDFSKKRISYVLATNNRSEFLKSFLINWSQFKKPIDELIIVDGSMSSESKKIIDDFDEIVDLYVSEPDLNGVEAYNKGYLLAQGEFIKNVMDDDIFHPEAFEQAVGVMQNNPSIDFLVCGGTRSRNGKDGYIYVAPKSNFGKSTDEVYNYTRSGAGFFFRRKLFALTGLWEVDSVSCDAAFIIRSISLGAKVRFCRINMVHHLLHADSKSVKDQEEKFIERDRLIRRYCSSQYQAKWFRNQKLYYKILKWLWKLYKSIFTNNFTNNNLKKDPIWDGGLS
jgi:glycosyltransferase involved in cell wall biosynthesis